MDDTAGASPAPPSVVEVSVVVPFYNPGGQLAPMIAALVEELTGAGVTFEIIAVDDGSTDGSAATIGDHGDDVRILGRGSNRGKGRSIRDGFAVARGAWVGFIDADGDIAAHHIVDFHAIARLTRPAAVVGSKIDDEAAVDASVLRRLCSFGFRTGVRALFRLGVADTQTGVKLFRRDVVDEVLSSCHQDRFALDLELLVLTERGGYGPVLTAPVVIRDRRQTTVRASTVLELAGDALAVWRAHRRS